MAAVVVELLKKTMMMMLSLPQTLLLMVVLFQEVTVHLTKRAGRREQGKHASWRARTFTSKTVCVFDVRRANERRE